ncbi:unnamed protein product [Heligmosomoides polygyrus]|uniref:Uncharacterized protein n=1 Tax=Heligmosomoides polygyrus TaxID=6339 RepID=A0A183F2N6_HELPZ|nr:unnamed protein product [Heligmosomoides polygyrus]
MFTVISDAKYPVAILISFEMAPSHSLRVFIITTHINGASVSDISKTLSTSVPLRSTPRLCCHSLRSALRCAARFGPASNAKLFWHLLRSAVEYGAIAASDELREARGSSSQCNSSLRCVTPSMAAQIYPVWSSEEET